MGRSVVGTISEEIAKLFRAGGSEFSAGVAWADCSGAGRCAKSISTRAGGTDAFLCWWDRVADQVYTLLKFGPFGSPLRLCVLHCVK